MSTIEISEAEAAMLIQCFMNESFRRYGRAEQPPIIKALIAVRDTTHVNPNHELILECCGKPESECKCEQR